MIFDEKFLQQEIEMRWGKHGAHAEVYRMLLARNSKATKLLNRAYIWLKPDTSVSDDILEFLGKPDAAHSQTKEKS